MCLDDPWRDEFGEPIAPYVLVHGDRNHQRASNRLVGIHGVGGSHGRKSGDLHTSASVANDNDCFPGPPKICQHGIRNTVSHGSLLLVTEGNDEVSKHHNKDEWDYHDHQFPLSHMLATSRGLTHCR